LKDCSTAVRYQAINVLRRLLLSSGTDSTSFLVSHWPKFKSKLVIPYLTSRGNRKKHTGTAVCVQCAELLQRGLVLSPAASNQISNMLVAGLLQPALDAGASIKLASAAASPPHGGGQRKQPFWGSNGYQV
jgi:hypothetical protein